MPASDTRQSADRPSQCATRPTLREVVLFVLLLVWIAAVLASEHGPMRLTPPLVPYGAAEATASSAAMSPPLIRGR